MTSTLPIPFIPKNAADALALEIARSFGDETHLSLYRQVCATHNRSLVYRAYREALDMPAERVRKSRRAIFFFIVHQYDRANHSRD